MKSWQHIHYPIFFFRRKGESRCIWEALWAWVGSVHPPVCGQCGGSGGQGEGHRRRLPQPHGATQPWTARIRRLRLPRILVSHNFHFYLATSDLFWLLEQNIKTPVLALSHQSWWITAHKYYNKYIKTKDAILITYILLLGCRRMGASCTFCVSRYTLYTCHL